MSHSVKVLQIFDRKLFFCGPKIGFLVIGNEKYLISFNVLACLIIFIQRSQYIRPKVIAHKCAGIIWGMAFYEEIR